MAISYRSALTIGILAAACIGCSQKPAAETAQKPVPSASEIKVDSAEGSTSEESAQAKESPKKTDAAAHHKAAKRKKKPQEPAPAAPTTVPKVEMSQEIQAGCVVKVGDVLPSLELPGIDGHPHSLESLAGEKLTVVCFWSAATPRQRLSTIALLQDLTHDVVESFGDRGVRVAAINVGDAAANVREDMQKAKATFPCLLDAKRELFARVAKDHRTPRIYLLDAEGKILWFDVEYSRPTQESLQQALRVTLGK
jgi:peroxiredoxin